MLATLSRSGVARPRVQLCKSRSSTRPRFEETDPYGWRRILAGEAAAQRPSLIRTELPFGDRRFPDRRCCTYRSDAAYRSVLAVDRRDRNAGCQWAARRGAATAPASSRSTNPVPIAPAVASHVLLPGKGWLAFRPTVRSVPDVFAARSRSHDGVKSGNRRWQRRPAPAMRTAITRAWREPTSTTRLLARVMAVYSRLRYRVVHDLMVTPAQPRPDALAICDRTVMAMRAELTATPSRASACPTRRNVSGRPRPRRYALSVAGLRPRAWWPRLPCD